MAKASLLPPCLTPKYQNLSQIAQEISSGEMSEVTKKSEKVTTPQARCSSSEGLLIWRCFASKNPNYDGLDFRGVEVVLTCILFFRTPCLCSTVCRLVSDVMICGINVYWNKSQNYPVNIFCIQSFKANSNDAMQCSNRMQEQTCIHRIDKNVPPVANSEDQN